MQPKDRRLVTERNLDQYTQTELVPVRNTAQDADLASQEAISEAQSTQQQTANAIDRLESLEAMSGLEPGDVIDAQTANLIQQPDSSTRQAFSTTLSDEIYSDETAGGQALQAVTTDLVGNSPVWVQHGDDADFPRPQTLRPVQWHGFVEPEHMEDGDMYVELIEPAVQVFDDFSRVQLGQFPREWVREWDLTGTVSVEDHDGSLNGKVLQISPEGYGRRAVRWAGIEGPDGIGQPQEAEGLLRFIASSGASDPYSMALVFLGSGTAGNETGVLPAVFDDGRVGIQVYNKGQSIRIVDAPKPLTDGVAYWLRGRIEGNTAMVKVWEDGIPEPAEWDDSQLFPYEITQTPGWVGVSSYRYEDSHIDSVSFAVEGHPAPSEPVN